MKKLLPICTVLLAVILGPGCGAISSKHLEAGGAYAQTETHAAMPELYLADSAYKTAEDSLNVVFNYELNNRAALWAISHDIKHELDKLRDQAWQLKLEWALARDAYLSSPVPANLSAMQQALAKFQQLNTVAGTVLANQIKTP